MRTFGIGIVLLLLVGFVSAQSGSSSYYSSSASYADSYAGSDYYGSSGGFSGASGSASYVNYGYPADFQRYYAGSDSGLGPRIDTYFPILKEPDSCFARQDIILQVAPAGCQPAVVRSDLLAEQNVPVFCQIDALKINPLIDVKEIRNIRFSGAYPEGVVGVGFHPARAALRTRSELLGSPLINNIGYAVVVLKRNPVEKDLPDFINFTLSASLDYYAGNALGIGRTQFLLQQVPDSLWSLERDRQSFFRGQYSVRLIEADPNAATVTIYKGDVPISTRRVEKGKDSGEVYIPGSYCQVGLKLIYDGFVSADKTAKIQVGEDVIDVYQGSRFLNDKCTVRNVRGDFTNGTVDVSCSGNKPFTLGVRAKTLEAGAVVELNKDSSRWIVEGTVKKGKDLLYNLTNADGQSILVNITAITPVDSKILFEKEYGGQIDDYFDNAIASYKEVAESYTNEKEPEIQQSDNERLKNTVPSYGEKALEEAIALSDRLTKEETEARLIEQFIELYPASEKRAYYENRLQDLYEKDSSLGGVVILIDNDYKTIKLIEVTEPGEKSSAEFVWGGKSLEVEEGASGASGDFGNLTLDRVIDQDSVRVTSYCRENINGQVVYRRERTSTLSLTQTETSACGQSLRLRFVNLEEQAKIRIEPIARTTSVTNFTVGVGIEKRAIKLNPDKARERIDNLNKTIAKWESISQSLNRINTGLKTACFATAGILTVKNFFTGLGGESMARQEVMRGDNGWTAWCQARVNEKVYDSMTQCYNAKSSEINKDVNAYSKAIKLANDKIEAIESNPNNIVQGGGGIFGGDSIDNDKAKAELITELKSKCSDVSAGDGQTIGQLFNGLDANLVGYDQVRDMYMNCLIAKGEGGAASAEIGTERAKNELGVIGGVISDRKDLFNEAEGLRSAGIDVFVAEPRGSIRGDFYGKNAGDHKSKINGIDSVPSNAPFQVVSVGSNRYGLVLGAESGGNYLVEDVYTLDSAGESYTATKLEGSEEENAKRQFSAFRKVDANSYFNKFAPGEAKVRYYESQPYKGMPAVVPFDLEEGWYVATQQTLPGFGGIKAFESSGRPVSFWICNVMKDGRIGFYSSGFGDDVCVQFNQNTGQALDKFPGLTEQRTRDLVSRATQALNQAAEQHGKGSTVRILGKSIQVGESAAAISGTQCQDFMSPEECLLMFNVCDPVICPSSRCNLGGTYQVDNVISSGIVGSALLCLPNAKEGIAVPVCLTGIQAGIDGYLSVLKQHQACLEENIRTGQTVGICDEIYSVYLCEFFWRQAAPAANILLPKIVDLAYNGGQRARGGGEYLTVANAWENAQDTASFFTQNYAVNSIEAFKIRSVEEAGTPVCRAFISLKGPKSFESLVQPDSPPQFHAWFSSIPFNDVTVPSTAQYKVYYHIFAGNDAGVGYSVYLKDPPATSFVHTAPLVVVATGFAPKGGSVSETRDFTAPTGYQQLCVSINGKEECGFKQVTSSFAINAVRDELIKGEITRKDISSQEQCISGRTNPTALLNPNIQEGVQEVIDPAIYNRGVSRICATDNPGKGTEPDRFVEVGHCGDVQVKCWLDQESVDKAITANNIGAKKDTFDELEAQQKEILSAGLNVSGFYDDGQARTEIQKLESNLSKVDADNVESFVKTLNSVLDQMFWNWQKARLVLLRGKAYGQVIPELMNRAGISTDYRTPVDGGEKALDESAFFEEPEGVTETVVDQLILSLEVEYDPARKIFVLENGALTEIYLQNNRVYYKTSINELGVISGNVITLKDNLPAAADEIESDVLDYLDGAMIEGTTLA